MADGDDGCGQEPKSRVEAVGRRGKVGAWRMAPGRGPPPTACRHPGRARGCWRPGHPGGPRGARATMTAAGRSDMASANPFSLRALRRYAALALLALAAASCGEEPTAPVVEPPPPLTPEAALAQRLAQGWTYITPGLRGVSVAVLTRDAKLYTASVGASTPWPGAPALGPAHRFRVASVSKIFAAALILKLAEEGRLSLDDPLTKHWPDCPVPNARTMTIRQLLSHTAGVFDHLNADAFWDDPSFSSAKVWTLDEIVGFAVRGGALFAPGTSYAYSNTGICILGGVVERILGVSYATAVERYLTTPLGLTNSLYDDFSTAANKVPGLAESSAAYSYHPTAACAAGAMVSTPTDMARLARAVYGGRFLSAASTSAMTQNLGKALGGQDYGLGTRLWTRAGTPYHGHTGSLMDYRTIVMYVPSGDLTIAMAANGAHGSWTSLTYDIFDFAVARF
ncbi:MAG: beta-lactamase family protein [Gemmatimonadetes bacterium]|nr:beta-lactamase family protein [Gemmatimonadota bacterium]